MREKGCVIVKNGELYYDGMNGFKKDLRDAKIYHTEKGATNTLDTLIDRGFARKEDLVLMNVTITLEV